MTLNHALAHGDASRAASRARHTINKNLKRFSAKHRDAIQALASQHSHLADLAVSFPALLFALAVPARHFTPAPVIANVIAGMPLNELAQQANLPRWTRRLMPEAFAQPLSALPDGEWIARQICNHLPRNPRDAALWLDVVGQMHEWGTPDMAIWIAREVLRDPAAVKVSSVRSLALYGTFSCMPETYAGKLIETPWTPSLQIGAAGTHAGDWFKRLILFIHLGSEDVNDTWLAPATINGVTFVPLRTIDDICDEAKAMLNCVRDYGASIARHQIRLWSVRIDGKRVATLSIGKQYGDPVAQIEQIRGPKNECVPEAVALAAHTWLRTHELLLLPPHTYTAEQARTENARWRSLWRPYWLLKKRIPSWLPLTTNIHALYDL
jgi:hypothetical protein